MTESLAHGYSTESTQRDLSNEYQHDRVFKNLYVLALYMNIASALEELTHLLLECTPDFTNSNITLQIT